MTDAPHRHTFLPKHISWLTIALAALAVVTFIAISSPSTRYAVPMGGGVMEYGGGYTKSVPGVVTGMPMMDGGVYNSSDSSQGVASPDMMYYPYPYPYPSPDVPVSDTREFLKVYYNATMQTRDVQALTRRVETTVRGYDGRIDSESSNPKYSYISFAVPQSKYDAFRTELEAMVDSRFLTVNISSQNFLPQKQSIEEQQKQADTALADYKTARQKIVNAHISAVQSLQAQINATSATSSERVSLEKLLASENASYARKLSNSDANIKYAEDWVKGVQTQDATLLANVATVNGTISIQWISLWDTAQLYLPGYWIPAIFATLAYLSLMWDRRRFGAA